MLIHVIPSVDVVVLIDHVNISDSQLQVKIERARTNRSSKHPVSRQATDAHSVSLIQMKRLARCINGLLDRLKR